MAWLCQTPLTWLGTSISGTLDQILGSAAQKPANYFQAEIAGAPATWPLWCRSSPKSISPGA
jgi:hypothetical protein